MLDPRLLTGQNSLVSHHVTFALSSAEYIYISKYFECKRVMMKTSKKITHRMWDLGFSQRFLWRSLSSGIERRVVNWKSIYVSEVYIASIIRTKEYANKKPKWKQMASRNNLRARLCLPHDFTLASCSNYSSTLKMEAMCSSETYADFQRTIRRYIPECCLWN
jgi:hypothetical protein